MILRSSNILDNVNNEWKEVKYPQEKVNSLNYLLATFIILLTIFFLFVSNALPSLALNIPVIQRSISFNGLINLMIVTIWRTAIYKSFRVYFNLVNRNKSWIANNLAYMIGTLKLFDQEYFETTRQDNKVVREKRIVRVVRIYYRETEKYVYGIMPRKARCQWHSEWSIQL